MRQLLLILFPLIIFAGMVGVAGAETDVEPAPGFGAGPGDQPTGTANETDESDEAVPGDDAVPGTETAALTAGGSQWLEGNSDAESSEAGDQRSEGDHDGEGRKFRDAAGIVPSTDDGDESVDPVGARCKTVWYSVPDDEGEPVWHELTLYCWVCSSERIDEVRTGERSDGRGFGAYAEHLGTIGGYVVADVGVLPDGLGADAADPGSIVVRNEVGSYGELYMPVFSYCRRDDTWAIEYAEAGRAPTIGLTAYLPDNFDIDGTRSRLWDEFYPRLLAYGPELGSTPPIEQGRLFVRLPTWFWVENPVLEDQLEAVSDLGTIRVSIRARLQSVEWQWGGEKQRCLLHEMRKYEGHGVATLTPPCSKTFLKRGTPEIAATSRYYVEERVQYRPSRFDPWPDVAWVENVPAIADVRTTAGPIGIGEILSLVVAID